MGKTELIILSIGLAMDAFSVAICKGLAMKKMNWKHAIIIGLYFGGFQALMPAIGYFLGVGFENQIASIDHWIAFVLLGLIGGKMIVEAIKKEDDVTYNNSIGVKVMLILAIATSIDALAVGITLAFLRTNIILAVALIGIITFAISVVGVKIGNIFGDKYEKKAELAGGLILIFIGTKILLEHTGVL